MNAKVDLEMFLIFVVGAVIANVATLFIEKQLFPEDF